MIATADFAAAATSSTDEGTLPDRSTPGYAWFALPSSIGYPSNVSLDGGMFNPFREQTGTVDDGTGVDYVVGVTGRQQTGRNGRIVVLVE